MDEQVVGWRLEAGVLDSILKADGWWLGGQLPNLYQGEACPLPTQKGQAAVDGDALIEEMGEAFALEPCQCGFAPVEASGQPEQ